jgi:hypothetical protein
MYDQDSLEIVEDYIFLVSASMDQVNWIKYFCCTLQLFKYSVYII